MTATQRIRSMLDGSPVKEIGACGWLHTIGADRDTAEVFSSAIIKMTDYSKWDFIKVMPNGVYNQEAHGSDIEYFSGPLSVEDLKAKRVFQFHRYLINSVKDMEAFPVLDVSKNAVYQREVNVVRALAKGDPKEAVNVANLIVSDPTVIAGMGSFSSSCAMAAAPVFEEADLLLFSPNASHTDFPAMGENMFSAVMSQKYEGAEFADALIEMFGAQNVAILYQNTDHGVIATDVFTKQYEAGGGKVIMSETFIPGQTKDFSPVLSRIKEQDPDLFYVNASYNDCAQIFMQAKALNMDCQLVGPGMLLTEEFLDVVGNKIDGTIVMSSVPAFLPSVLESGELDAASKNFVDSYTAEYNEVPDGFAASAFDAVNIVLDAVAKVGTDTPALREELKTLRDYPGVSGYNMSFNEQKEMVKGIYLFEIQDGQFVRVK